jgi:hypothetical protein
LGLISDAISLLVLSTIFCSPSAVKDSATFDLAAYPAVNDPAAQLVRVDNDNIDNKIVISLLKAFIRYLHIGFYVLLILIVLLVIHVLAKMEVLFPLELFYVKQVIAVLYLNVVYKYFTIMYLKPVFSPYDYSLKGLSTRMSRRCFK